ncbi:23S rRNA (uracil-5-)-methyltransferase RumA [Elizabethkingia miricola]|jgi:23S rRNA (uracil1939-C5)-methyltransferase|uniref:RNA methyltransferase n=1 Tax=Elizabethkingia miricola TaxID=172045 RepID=A0AAQ1SX85_ELIMR|nr:MULTISPECIES: 23S rRNA (uracil(1939)-C(5))-methyltransferase RlmD [Elizabethkingia]KUY19470.1 RNA methyltransferase [Elizabethkingia miricola]MCL1651085.1 23S rRNA (uracil(1939)-C(5))-methyltransferase RlmD [Elizabethkingia miricola]MCL1678204.1 23S rRNA (uracil(1939)-C(5))-methyltransferase RlmD [Elizabethkingia miricola]NHQ65399.1 23S rRNA (uracil(1939)-C(5))-methyltransferase RlmD [Elizabethkingia miricola]NHQ70823.1 23S rRNA (uracil(1939)-C(5))-methyltransferase RlmD [Elizabethkingia mi
MQKKKKNVILENIKLLSAGAKGVSVGKTEDGKTILVSGAVPGDLVNARMKKSKKNYIEAEAIEILEESPDRVDARCMHFSVCGGCKWQNLSYEKQLEFKEDEVLNNIRRIGGIDGFEALPILGSAEQYFYRNKMEFSFSNARWLTLEEVNSTEEIADRNALGFHIPGQWSKILDLKECFLQEDPSNNIRLAVKEYAEENNLEFFDVRNQEGFLRTLMMRQNSKGEWMVLFQLFEENETERVKLLDYLLQKFPQIHTLLYAINPKGNDSIYDLDIQTYYGEGFLYEEMDGLRFKIGPKSFFQTNYKQALELYRKTLEFADLKGDEVVYDLYTGTGTIAQYVARNAKQVIGIEAVQEAIDAAKEHAELNGLTNCTFYCGDMKDIFNQEFLESHPKADVLITDPPRDGMHAKVVEQILNLSPEKIVYVSCNSATQARDLAMLKEHYNLVKVLPVDMFPQTHHVENIALLIKKS